MIIAQPRWQNNMIQVLSRAITDVVTAPTYNCKQALNGLMYRHNRSGFMIERDVYYNFRHDGAEAFGYYNYANPPVAKLTKVGTTTFVANSHVQFGGTAGYYNTNTFLEPKYGRSHGSHHWSGFGGGGTSYPFGLNGSGSGYTMYDTGVGMRLHCISTDGKFPVSGPYNTLGYFVIGRSDLSTIYSGKNGVRDANVVQNDAGFSLPSQNMYLGARNSNGTAAGTGPVSDRYYSFGDVSTAAMDTAVYNAEIEFETCLATVLP